MRTKIGQSSRSAGGGAKTSTSFCRDAAAGQTRPAFRPESPAPGAAQEPWSPRETPFRLVPVFAPRRTAVEEIGEALGEDFSAVRIDPRSREAADLGARAFARDGRVGFAPGEYRPETAVGLRLLAHELVHVAQQRREPVPATGQIGDHEVNEDPRLEEEAERIGSLAAAGAAGAPPPPVTSGFSAAAGRPSSPAQLHKYNQAARAAGRSREAQRAMDRERDRRQREIERLAGKSVDELVRQWRGIRLRTNRTLAKIREIDQISQGVVRPRRLQGADRDNADLLDRLNVQAQGMIGVLEHPAARRDRNLESNKKALATLILRGREVERELGEISSQAEARLGPRENFAGDLNTNLYHTGAQNDPIPIVWYKDPDAYEDIVIPAGGAVTAGNYAFPDGPTIADGFPVDLTVADENQPELNNLAGFELRKQPIGSRPAQTPNQVAANAALAAAGYNLRTQNPAKDGDHVRDLGFGGDDAVDNYWPLNERINRRAFHGYNSSYVINFIDHTKDAGQANPNGNPNGRPISQPVGGMAGRYFVVKEYMDSADQASIPDESEEEAAGTA